MADVLGTIVTVAEVVQKILKVYHMIDDFPDHMDQIGKRMELLAPRLAMVDEFLRRQTIDASRTVELAAIVKVIQADSLRVEDIFTKYQNDVGPFGLRFRFKNLTQMYYALGSTSDELKALGERIDKHRSDLLEGIEFLKAFGLDDVHKIIVHGQEAPGNKKADAAPRLAADPCDDVSIIFVDPYNEERSIVAEGYTHLVREWTVRTGGSWRVNVVHSAGFFVRNPSFTSLDDVISGGTAGAAAGLRYRRASYKLDMRDSAERPNKAALAALFDNDFFGHPFKQDVRRQTEARWPRGLTRALFKKYDYVIAFTDREYHNLIWLREALIERDGKEAVLGVTSRKGRIVQLGHYGQGDAVAKSGEILAPKDVDDRAQWEPKVDQIKVAFKHFLEKELGWKKPQQGALVAP